MRTKACTEAGEDRGRQYRGKGGMILEPDKSREDDLQYPYKPDSFSYPYQPT